MKCLNNLVNSKNFVHVLPQVHRTTGIVTKQLTPLVKFLSFASGDLGYWHPVLAGAIRLEKVMSILGILINFMKARSQNELRCPNPVQEAKAKQESLQQWHNPSPKQYTQPDNGTLNLLRRQCRCQHLQMLGGSAGWATARS